MKSLWSIAPAVLCLVALATLLQCGGSKTIPLLTITTAALPNGTAGSQYTQQVQANGGVAPYHWDLVSGTLPNNLQLGTSNTASDTISGIPDTPVQQDAFTVKVTDSANQTASQPYQVSILGLPDTLTLSPASLTFNPQLTGSASSTQTATLTNTGSEAIAINSVVPTGSNAADFSQSNSCGSNLAAGANCAIMVTFTPNQAGPRVASITINDDTAGTPHQVGLNGIGLSSGANATLSATTLTFNGQEVGTTSPAQTLTLTNYGEATLNIGGIAASGNFSESNTCGPTLAPGANCPISVSFAPASSGALTGSLSVSDNMTGSPQTVTLNGTGAASGTPVLSGMCVDTSADPEQCEVAQSADCPVGEVAMHVANFECPRNSSVTQFDNSRGCAVSTPRVSFYGNCATQAALASSRAVARKSCK